METTIENLEEKLRQAMLTSDVPVLDELIADDLVWTMHTGQVVNKQFDLDAHRSGLFQFTKVETSDRQIHQYDSNCIVVTLKAELAGTSSGEAFSAAYRFTRVWVQRQNRWQIVAGHVSQVILFWMVIYPYIPSGLWHLVASCS
ncbi:nuclear transport factor 2 family protein [Oculatella sp. LEGE 06141]|uniref:nuclear transport factor 2 family protein n=1 Tax=Oculatella sp. LEGE 06141 TaxID=1828648 RepID=UPI00187FC0F1|nr:nuclear transport factor 2 family protein [Oculatella sp. LEGE 06141]MBE9177785.1 nuclear transport factor 2 family protein [Oculatella sp. LEGE 06141]